MKPLAIVGARLLDARSEAPIDGDIVVVGEGGRIAAVGRSRASIPDDATILDAAGRTVVPGLIDCHVHLISSYEALHDTVRRSYSESIALMLDTGRRFLEQGVTTARDAGFTPAGIKRVFARGEYAGPRLQVSVMPLSITAGHADGTTPSGIDLNQGLAESELPPAIADGPDAVRRAVRRQIGAGADWIKVMATGGVYSLLDAPDAVQFTIDEIRIMVEEAADAGAHGVLAHAENARGIKNAVRAGVRSIEHGEGLDEEAAQLMVERDVALVPTFLVSEEMLREDRVASGITPPWAVEKGRELLAAEHAKLGLALQHGVRIAMGTDGGHDSHLPSELSLLVEHGMTPLSALHAATVEAARLLGLEAEIGTLDPGKRADVILLDFDPLTEPASWRDAACVSAVVKDGRVVVDRSAGVASKQTS